MSLSTITEKDFRQKKTLYHKLENHSLKTADISGAQPKLKGYEYTNKPPANYSKVDPEKPVWLERIRPLNSLTTHDIDKATPAAPYLGKTRVGHNPLNPEYQLSTIQFSPVTPPKFVRDSIAITDIEGSSPASRYRWAPRNTHTVDDIPGAQPKQPKIRKGPNFMDPRDINKGESSGIGWSTNPLMPEYKVRDGDGQVVIIGEVEKSKPRDWFSPMQVHARHLATGDIEGAQADTLGKKPFRGVRDPRGLSTSDIQGAQAGSLKKGISTIRTTNPLNPQYQWLTEEPQKIQLKQSPSKNSPQKCESSLCNKLTSASGSTVSKASSNGRESSEQCSIVNNRSSGLPLTYKFKLTRSEVAAPARTQSRSRSSKLISSAKSLF